MTIEKTVCDECGRVKGEANHWHKMGFMETDDHKLVRIELGYLHGPDFKDMRLSYEVHDLCGEQCFYKHIGKLLKLNPAVEE